MLDVRWLEDLVVLAETRSFTRASEIRNVTQSSLSRRIQSLEHWAGAPLIDRQRTPLALTPAGHQLLDVAGGALGLLNGVRHAIREDQDERLRTVRLAAPHILSVTFFPRWLPLVQQKIGPTRVSILFDNLPGCCAALEDGGADFIVCFVDEAGAVVNGAGRPLAIEGCSSLLMGRERLIPLSAPDENGAPLHGLGRGPRLSASYLGYSPECSLGWAVEALTSKRPDLPQLNCLYENSLADGLRTMALSGLGVAWLPLTTCHQDILRGRLVRAGDVALDVALDIRIHRPARRLSRKSEELWMRLSVETATLACPEISEVAEGLRVVS